MATTSANRVVVQKISLMNIWFAKAFAVQTGIAGVEQNLHPAFLWGDVFIGDA
jgi:hypothetical protein